MIAPPGIEKDLESVSETWGDFGGGGEGWRRAAKTSDDARAEAPNTRSNLQGARNIRLEEWINSIKPTKRPTLNFKHVLLPHVPWQYLPDGRQYRRVATEPVPGIGRQRTRTSSRPRCSSSATCSRWALPTTSCSC